MITGSLLEEDFLESQYLHRAKYVKRAFVILGCMAVIGAVIWLRFEQHFLGFVLFFSALGGFLGELIVRHLILPWRLRRVYQQHVGYKSPFTYSWDQEALSAESEIGHARRPWAHYIRSVENERIFLLYHSDAMFELIPKHWFNSPDQMAQFRSVVSRIGT